MLCVDFIDDILSLCRLVGMFLVHNDDELALFPLCLRDAVEKVLLLGVLDRVVPLLCDELPVDEGR